MSEPLLCAFLTSGHGELVRQLLTDIDETVKVVAVIRDRPSAVDDKGVPTGLRRGPTAELLERQGVELVDCYLPKRGGDKAARERKQEENVLFELGNRGVQLVCLVEYQRALLAHGPLLTRYAHGQMLRISGDELHTVSIGEDGTASFRSHTRVTPEDTLSSLLNTFAAPTEQTPATPSPDARWLSTAQQLGYATEAAMWADLYTAKGSSFKELADLFNAAAATIRMRLELTSTPIRPRGGADRRKPLADSELDTILAEGIAAAARRLGIGYQGLYKRVQAALAERRERAKAAGAKQ